MLRRDAPLPVGATESCARGVIDGDRRPPRMAAPRWTETAMSDELRDPLFERVGPILLRLFALISVALIAVPLALVLAVPFFG